MGEEAFQRGEPAHHLDVSHQRSCAHTHMPIKALVILAPPTFPKLSIAPRSTNQRMQVQTGRLIFFQSHRQRWAVAECWGVWRLFILGWWSGGGYELEERSEIAWRAWRRQEPWPPSTFTSRNPSYMLGVGDHSTMIRKVVHGCVTCSLVAWEHRDLDFSPAFVFGTHLSLSMAALMAGLAWLFVLDPFSHCL